VANRHTTSAKAVEKSVVFANDPILPRDAIPATNTAPSALLRQTMTGEGDNHQNTNATNADK
jgi:hypothetical protein